MYHAIMKAKEEIFIADWFLSPQVFLIREDENGIPILKNQDYRLDVVLKNKAMEGVKIYVLPWNETKIALSLNSRFAQETLEKLHPNIKVQRHPLANPIKWSHHQKLLIVDQCVAFVGGLDLCFGRYDNKSHLLSDLSNSQTWKGKE